MEDKFHKIIFNLINNLFNPYNGEYLLEIKKDFQIDLLNKKVIPKTNSVVLKNIISKCKDCLNNDLKFLQLNIDDLKLVSINFIYNEEKIDIIVKIHYKDKVYIKKINTNIIIKNIKKEKRKNQSSSSKISRISSSSSSNSLKILSNLIFF